MSGSDRVLRSRLSHLKWLPFDSLMWCAAMLLASWVRLDFSLHGFELRSVLLIGFVAALVNLVSGLLVGTYLHRYVYGSFDEAAALAGSALLTTTAVFVAVVAISPPVVPRSVPVLGGAFALLGLWAVRFVGRAWSISRARRPRTNRVLVFGAGEAGQQLLRQIHADASSQLRPVALLDDDLGKRRLRFSGVGVKGTRVDIAKVAERYRADSLVIALPTAPAELVRDLTSRATAVGLRVLILPPLEQLMRRQVGASDLRDVDVVDLLGRRPVQLDQRAIAARITGRKVLVTGAGGSIGSELCRQIHRFGPSELIMLDRDESALHAIQLSLYGQAMLDGTDTVLADIRDAKAVRRVFETRRPDVVFHAAALKHLPLLERFPIEAWMTNVVGTALVLRASEAVGVSTFVNISTDKAANPTSVLGTSKRVSERLTADSSLRATGRYVSVRFGNVLGSRGSVLTAFERQIAEGGPVTVTHPDVTRYFMTVAEACQLVLQAAAIGSDGEALVLDMGSPVGIVDVAKTLIERSERDDIDIVYTGLRAGEKLHEDLFGDDEPRDRRPAHPLVSHVMVPRLHMDGGAVLELMRFDDDDGAREWMWNEGGAEAAGVTASAKSMVRDPGASVVSSHPSPNKLASRANG